MKRLSDQQNHYILEFSSSEWDTIQNALKFLARHTENQAAKDLLDEMSPRSEDHSEQIPLFSK